MEDQSEPVQVFVRIRPEFDEIGEKSTPLKANASFKVIGSPLTQLENTCVTSVDDRTLRITPPDEIYGTRKTMPSADDKVYHFDRIFTEASSQEDIYDAVADNVLATVKGYNTTIFAYGVTGSGKSYTMTGNKQAPGIIPRAIADIFKHIEKSASESDIFFYVRLSYVELYNNNFRNLLENIPRENLSFNRTANSSISMSGFFSELDEQDAHGFEAHYGTSFAYARMTSSAGFKEHPGLASRSDKIEVRESKSAGTFLHGPNLRFPVTSAVEAFQLISKGNKMRAVASTNCNEESSRSHAILTFHVESKVTISSIGDATPKTEMRIGKIHLVDLAGSERLAISGAEGDTLIETKNINSSLTALGDVLSALSKNATIVTQRQKQVKEGLKSMESHQPPTLSQVPYRNSKLTHLLKDSLGGNSKTVMITNIRKTKEYYHLTNISLMYASRAKKVRNRSTINRNVLGDSAIHTVSSELERFKKVLEDKTNEFERLKLHVMSSESEKSALKTHLRDMKNSIENEKRLYEEKVSHLIHSHAGQIASQKEKITQLQSALQDELTLSQNRIAEQEQEIKWLKKALDESNLVANQDQIEKMKKIVEVWQNQAKTANHELNVVLNQAEELKTINTTLQNKLRESEQDRKLLDDELSQRIHECDDLSRQLFDTAKDKEELLESLAASKKGFEEARAMLKDQLQSNSDREKAVKENQKLIESLENELKAARDTNTTNRNKISQLNQKIHELETDKSELTSKLSVSIQVLEKKSQEMVEDLKNQLQQKNKSFEEFENRVRTLQDQLDKQAHAYSELKEISNIKLAQKDKSIEELEAALQRELQISSKQASKLLIAEGDVEGLKDKINRLQNKLKEKGEQMDKVVQDKSNIIQSLEQQLQLSKESLDRDRHKLISEFEKIMEEKRLAHSQDLRQLQEQQQGLEQSKDQVEKELMKRIHQLESDLKERDVSYDKNLKEREQQFRKMIDEELRITVEAIEKKHQEHLDLLQQQHEEEKHSSVHLIQRTLSTDHEQALFQLELQLKSVHESKLKDALQIQQKALRQEALEQKEKLIADLEQKHLSEVRQYEKQIQELKASLKQQLVQAQNKYQLDYEQDLLQVRNSLEIDFKQQLTTVQTEHELLVSRLKDDFQQSLVTTVKKEKEQLAISLKAQFEKQTQAAVELACTELRKNLVLEHSNQWQSHKEDLQSKHQKDIQEKEDEIQQLNDKIMQMLISHKDELRKALTDKEQTLLESSNAEIERLQTELAEKKRLFQNELTELRKAHNDDMFLQKSELEKVHQQVVSSIQEELRTTRVAVTELEEELKKLQLASAASLEDVKLQAGQKVQEEIEILQKHQDEKLQLIVKQHEFEVQQLKSKLSKLKESHTEEVQRLMDDASATNDRLKEKHSKEIEELRAQFLVELKNVKEITSMTKDDEIQEVQENMKQLILSKEEEISRLQKEIANAQARGANESKEKAQRIQELEDRIDLLQSGKEDLNKKYVDEVRRLEEKLARSEQAWKAKYEEEFSRLEVQHDEILSNLKAQFRKEMQQLKEESNQELSRQSAESRQALETKDAFYQKELENLRQLSNKNTQLREKVDQLQEEILQNRQEVHRLEGELHEQELSNVSEKKKLEREWQSKLDNLVQAKEKDLAAMQKEQLQALKEKENMWNEEKAEIIGMFEQKISDYIVQLEQLQQSHDWQLQQKEEALSAENATLQTIIKSIRQKSEEEIQAIQRQDEDQIRTLTSQYESRISTMTEALKKDSENYHHLLKKYHTEKAEMSLELDNEKEVNQNLSQLSKSLQDQLEREHDKYQQTIFQLEQALAEKEKQYNDMFQSYQKEMDKTKKDSFIVIRERETSFEQQKETLVISYEEKLKEKEEYYSKERIPWIIKQSEKEKTQLLNEKNREIENLKTRQQEDLHDLEQRHSREIDAVKMTFSNEISSLKERIRLVTSESDRKITDLENNYHQLLQRKDDENSQKQEQIRQEVTAYYDRKINLLNETLAKSNQQEIQQIILQKDQEIHEALQERDNVQNLYASESKLKEQYHKQIQLLHKEIDLLKLESKNQIEKLDHQKEKELKELKKEYLTTTETIQQKEKQKVEVIEKQFHQEIISLQQVIHTKESELVVLQKQYQSVSQQESFLAQQLREKEEDYLRNERDLKERLSRQYQQQLDEERRRWESRLSEESSKYGNEIMVKQNELALLQQQLGTCNNEISLLNSLLKKQEKENQSLEQHYKHLIEEKEQFHQLQNKELLEQQRRELQDEHLISIQKQISFISQMIQSQSNNKHMEDLQSKFMDLIQDLPEYWRQKHNINFPSQTGHLPNSSFNNIGVPPPPPTISQPSFSTELETSNYQYGLTSPKRNTKTPIHLLAEASSDFPSATSESQHRGYFEEPSKGLQSRQLQPKKSSQHLPWSSPSLRASPSDQLISAILDGDVQGIRTVVRSKGEDLQSEFWKDLARSILPLHRAISGLHFHGNVDYLVATIDVLIQLGADVHATDHAGNGVLHKAIQICTSKSINVVIDCLLSKGANANVVNKDGDSPLHAECKRVRTASEHVISSLITAKGNPNMKNPHNSLITPLSLLLMRGAATTAFGSNLIQNLMTHLGGFQHQDDEGFGEQTPHKNSDSPSDYSKFGVSPDVERARASGRRVWLRALEALVKNGGRWDANWKSPQTGVNQLHLFVASFPPSREDTVIYRSLLKNALENGCNPNMEDDRGRNSLFILCEQLAVTPSDYCPDASRLVHYLLDAMTSSPHSILNNPNDRGVGGSDRAGRTIFDIRETVQNSCLQACRTILLQATARISSSSNPPVNAASVNHSNSYYQTSNGINGTATTNSFISKAQQSKLLSQSNTSSSNYYEKELPSHRVSSSFIVNQSNSKSTNHVTTSSNSFLTKDTKSMTASSSLNKMPVNPVKLFDGDSRFSLNDAGSSLLRPANEKTHSAPSLTSSYNPPRTTSNSSSMRKNYFDEDDDDGEDDKGKRGNANKSHQRYFISK